jgi:uncharacterized membrane protein
MTNLVIAALFLPLSHFLISSTVLRTILVRRLGEGYFVLAYSVVALGAFAWLIMAYRHAPEFPLWVAPAWVKVALLPIILAASLLVVAGLTTPNPVIVKSDSLFERPNIVRGVLRITRNPFFWGVGLFAIAHVIMTGHIAGMLAFGTVGFLGLAGAAILDAKKSRRHGRMWDSFAAATSSIPFLAMAQGRQRLVWREIGLWRSALAICVFLAALLFHQALFGGNPLAILWDAASQ